MGREDTPLCEHCPVLVSLDFVLWSTSEGFVASYIALASSCL